MAKGRSRDRERRIARINWMEFAEIVPREVHTVLLVRTPNSGICPVLSRTIGS